MIREGEERYLGDGLYASVACGQIKLRAPQNPVTDQVVYLEPEVWAELVRFVDDVRRQE